MYLIFQYTLVETTSYPYKSLRKDISFTARAFIQVNAKCAIFMLATQNALFTLGLWWFLFKSYSGMYINVNCSKKAKAAWRRSSGLLMCNFYHEKIEWLWSTIAWTAKNRHFQNSMLTFVSIILVWSEHIVEHNQLTWVLTRFLWARRLVYL